MKVSHLFEAADIPVSELRKAIQKDPLVSWMLKRDAEHDGPPAGMENFSDQLKRIKHLFFNNRNVRDLVKNGKDPKKAALGVASWGHESVTKTKPEDADSHILARAADAVKTFFSSMGDVEKRRPVGYNAAQTRGLVEFASRQFVDVGLYAHVVPQKHLVPAKPIRVYNLITVSHGTAAGEHNGRHGVAVKIVQAIVRGERLGSFNFSHQSLWRTSLAEVEKYVIADSSRAARRRDDSRHVIISALVQPDDVALYSGAFNDETRGLLEMTHGPFVVLRDQTEQRVRAVKAYQNGQEVPIYVQHVDQEHDSILSGIEPVYKNLKRKTEDLPSWIRSDGYGSLRVPKAATFSLAQLIANLLSGGNLQFVSDARATPLHALSAAIFEQLLELKPDEKLASENSSLFDLVQRISTANKDGLVNVFITDEDKIKERFEEVVRWIFANESSLHAVWVHKKRVTDKFDIQTLERLSGKAVGKGLHLAPGAKQFEIAEGLVRNLEAATGISRPTGDFDKVMHLNSLFKAFAAAARNYPVVATARKLSDDLQELFTASEV